MKVWLAKLQRQSLYARIVVLGLVLLVAGLAVAPVAGALHGSAAIWACALAAAVCYLGGASALAASHVLKGPQRVLYGMLLAVVLRTGLPLALAVACQICCPPLGNGGIMYYLLVFYPLGLITEIWLSLGEIPGSRPPISSTVPHLPQAHD
ncbi:MAG: hypothetical protein ABSG68_18980 [Thermoguttaceae bacterium]|jgi:hypothetical protein